MAADMMARGHAGATRVCPHSPCRYYLLAQRPQHAAQAQHGAAEAALPVGGALLSARCCNLAWPKTGGCVLAWLRHLPPQCSSEGPEALASTVSRMQQEHASMGKRLVRLLRRAVALTEPAGGSVDTSSSQRGAEGNACSGMCSDEAARQAAAAPGSAVGGDSGSGDGQGSSPAVHVELEAQHEGLLPCGGAIFVQITAAPEVLGAAGGGPSVGQQQPPAAEPGLAAAAQPGNSAEAGVAGAQGVPMQTECEQQRCASAAEAAVRWLLGEAAAADSPSKAGLASCGFPAAAASIRVRHVLLKPASPEDAALHARQQQVGQLFRPPPADGGDGAVAKALRFMRLEPLEQLQQAGLAAAVLHAHKMAQHLTMRLSCRSSRAEGGGRYGCAGGGGACGAASAHSGACSRCCARCVAALCAELNGCVVGLDAHLLPDRTDATWVLFLPGLQQLGRDELAAAVLRHLPPGA